MNNRRRLVAMGIAFLALATLQWPASVNAAVYKWVDEKGVTHYSETPPAKARSHELRIQSPGPSSTENATPAKSFRQQEAEFQVRQKAGEAQAAKEREALMATENEQLDMTKKCSIARARIAALQAARRSQLDWDNTRAITTEKSIRAFDKHGQELNSLGKFVDEECPPEGASMGASPPKTR